jgi:hypothetical protein
MINGAHAILHSDDAEATRTARGDGHLAPTSCRRTQELAVELASLIDRD